MHSNSKKVIYHCFYCNAEVTMRELKEVDLHLEGWNSEDRELLLDFLPLANNFRIAPYVHQSTFDFDILNLCRACFKEAEKQYLNE